ncbi:MAG: phosphonoacetaldehyde hydrolase [Propionibacteriaceae bacterium]|jgi:phosphonoacetaldehyde hydrolase|nr:phosphonoacetaldehyde hydrolase [Propionibacteriaceae bacterium]
MTTPITTVIFDWAGTTVDYGCIAPVNAFLTAFRSAGFDPTLDEVRAPMGMQKRAHIEAMLEGKPHTAADVDRIYAQFESALFDVLANHADPIPGVLETVATLRLTGYQIGSTTGYTRAMMDVVEPQAAKNGYAPDLLICPDDVGGIGRPQPYMVWENLKRLGTTSIDEVIKVGDTIADIQEGTNAGCISVGVLRGSSMVGLTEEEFTALSSSEARTLLDKVTTQYIHAGADHVIPDITALPALIESINQERGA